VQWLARWLGILGGSLGLTLAPLYACSAPALRPAVSLSTLERAPAVEPTGVERWAIVDAAALDAVCKPLSRRMALIELRTAADWRRFERAVGLPLIPPDFARGAVVGVVSRAGQPLSGDWPVTLEQVRACDGAGWLTAHFAPGNYLPDGTAFAETAWVEGVAAVLAVEVNGERFYPDRRR
jgi:hypothetical protein